MVESAAHRVDQVFAEAPVRQFVLTFPFPLRFLLAAEPKVLTDVLAVVQRGRSTFLIRRAGCTVSSGAKTGAVTLMQRFGSARNRNPHLHMLFLDGAYTFRGTKASFHRARRLQPDEWAKLLASLSRRIVRLLERRGLLIADPPHPVLEFDVGSALDQIQAACVKYGIAVGPHAGRKALTLYSVAPVDDSTGCGLLAQVAGFSPHAATVCEAHQRSKLERLCRYIPRPPIATKRLSLDRRGRVVYAYKRPCRDGSTQVVLEPLDCMARRAALVPRPRLNLTRFHGVFAPHGKHRARLVPHRPRGKVDNDQRTAPMSWMRRLKRVFAIDIESCPDCGGKLRVIASIEDPPLIRHILAHVQRREALLKRVARAPPALPQATIL